ncbi:TIGR03986 family CRISPR-associated RAMP protein [Frankia sp. Cas4]|uniref:TIGR03986 family type III CRISPR-associated RAMP protein n=1 Tax=Frankia sp. Cas4 TaxID=3073927 RepID=UPI002AD460F3|nr:TIGR03986 family CRISPR-associated RAMP protein [Frankia sp. Cas4]
MSEALSSDHSSSAAAGGTHTRSGRLHWQPSGADGGRLVVVDGSNRRKIPQPGKALVDDLGALAPAELDGLSVDYEWVKGQVRGVRRAGTPLPSRPPSTQSTLPAASSDTGRRTPSQEPATRASNEAGVGQHSIPPRRPGSRHADGQRPGWTRPTGPPSAQGSARPAVNAVDLFRNPYTFVPALARDGAGPLGDAPPAGHDVWEQDRWSGRIGVTLTAVTPLLLLDTAQAKPDDRGHTTYSVLLRDGRPHIPSTAVKGMLRAAYEAATNSRLGVFTGHDEPLGYRPPASAGLALVPARVGRDAATVDLLTGTAPLGQRSSPQAVMYAAWLPRYGSGSRRPVLYGDQLAPEHRDEVRVRLRLIQHYRWDKRRQDHAADFRYWQVVAIARAGEPFPAEMKVADPVWRDRFTVHEPLPDTREAAGWVCVNNRNFSRKHDERVFFGDSHTLKLTDTTKKAWTALVNDYRNAHRQADIWERPNVSTDRRGETPKPPRGGREKFAPPQKWLGREPGKTAWSRHLYEEGAEKLRPGDLCYALLDSRGNLDALYPVMIARELFSASPKDLLHPSLRPASTRDELSPADRVFGWVNPDGHGAYRGQLRVGPVTLDADRDAVGHAVADFGADGLPLAILGQPKPQQGRFYAAAGTSQYPMPLPPRTPRRDWYVPGRSLRGRKVYPHHAGLADDYWQNPTEDRTQKLDKGRYQEYRRPAKESPDKELTVDNRAFATGRDEQRDNQNRSVRGWVKPGVTFRFTLDVINLTEVELGALLWLLRLPAEHYHRFGLGKPLGFGSVRLGLDTETTELRTGATIADYYASFGDQLPGAAADVDTLIAVFEKASDVWPGRPHLAAFLTAALGDASTPVHYPRVRPAAMDRSVPVPPDPRGQAYAWFVQNEQERSNSFVRAESLPPTDGDPLVVYPAPDRTGPPR